MGPYLNSPLQGSDYLSKEKARLEKMLLSGSVHASKVEDMSRKTSILGHLLVSHDQSLM